MDTGQGRKRGTVQRAAAEGGEETNRRCLGGNGGEEVTCSDRHRRPGALLEGEH